MRTGSPAHIQGSSVSSCPRGTLLCVHPGLAYKHSLLDNVGTGVAVVQREAVYIALPYMIPTSHLWPIATVVIFYMGFYFVGEQEALPTHRAVVVLLALMVRGYMCPQALPVYITFSAV